MTLGAAADRMIARFPRKIPYSRCTTAATHLGNRSPSCCCNGEEEFYNVGARLGYFVVLLLLFFPSTRELKTSSGRCSTTRLQSGISSVLVEREKKKKRKRFINKYITRSFIEAIRGKCATDSFRLVEVDYL